MNTPIGRNGRFLRRLGALLVCGLLAGCLGGGSEISPVGGEDFLAAHSIAGPEQAESVMAVLDRYMDALNVLDMEAHVATYHFPHYRHASGEIVVWQTAREAMPILDVPPEKRRVVLRDVLEPDWDRSEWTRREIVQASDTKVHVVTRFDRLRRDGSVIKSFDSLYVLTLQDGRWGIKGRSSFAP